MPLIDLNVGKPDLDWAAVQFTIVGAGAAGLFLGLTLARRGFKVLVLESGHLVEDDERQSLNVVEQSGKPFGDAVWNRKRAIGGTTIAWGGQSLPFIELDFQNRSWVDLSGWPIRHADLREYYDAANEFMGVDNLDYKLSLAQLLGAEIPAFNPDVVDYHFSKWARVPNFFKLYRREIEDKIAVVYNANLVSAEFSESERVEQVEVGNFVGSSWKLPVRTLILAAGGIETNRILLNLSRAEGGGVLARSGWLGKAFMDHPVADVGWIEPADRYRNARMFGTRIRGGRRYSVRLSAGADWQRRRHHLNVSAGFIFDHPSGEFNLFQQVEDAARGKISSAVGETMRNLPETGRIVYEFLRHRVLSKPNGVARVLVAAEQPPSVSSSISLAAATDRFGVPLANIHWDISFQTWTTIVAFSEAIAGELSRLELGRLVLQPYLSVDEPDWLSRLSDANHHMGGTRMSSRPDQGVVTPDLQVWGVQNLYACSSSVFPTGSHSNPTLTLLALGARLVDHLATGREADRSVAVSPPERLRRPQP